MTPIRYFVTVGAAVLAVCSAIDPTPPNPHRSVETTAIDPNPPDPHRGLAVASLNPTPPNPHREGSAR